MSHSPLRRGHSFVLGTKDGHFTIYPGRARERYPKSKWSDTYVCEEYDPRKRPWYVGASTGPKDIVLVLDVSGSMGEPIDLANNTKWDLVKRAASETLDTLTVADHVNVVLFSDDAKVLWTESGLARALSENIDKIKMQLEEVQPANNTNFTAAFEAAFPLLWRNCDEEPSPCSKCEKIVLFLTDGRDTSRRRDESIKPSKMAEVIEGLQTKLERETGKRAAIFTFSMSEDADDAIPRQIACANSGAWAYVGPRTNPLDSLLSYYLYTSAGLRGISPVWIEPYEDASGLGIVTTVALPIYARGTEQEHDVFLGVVGHQVLLDELVGEHVSLDDVLHELIKRTRDCPYSVETPCELQVYRHARDDRALCTDALPANETNEAEDDAVASEEDDDSQNSCYVFRNDYYRRSLEKVSWKEAVSKCEDQGGELVSIDDVEELGFVSRVASIDGSWVGANKDGNEVFSWIDDRLPLLGNNSSYWGVQEPIFQMGNEECAAIDTRGVVGNMHAKSCDKRLSYICKFRSEGPCGENIGTMPDTGYFTIPHLGACIDISNALESTRPLSQAKNLRSREVVCRFGPSGAGNEEVICCDGTGK